MLSHITDDDIVTFTALADEAMRRRRASKIESSTAPNEGSVDPPHKNTSRLSADPYSQIIGLIGRSDGTPGFNVRKLRSVLTKRAALDERYIPYRNCVIRLLYGISTSVTFIGLENKDPWISALIILEDMPDSQLYPTRGLEREVASASAIRRLRDRGYQINPKDEGFEFGNGELERLGQEIYQAANRIGGQRLLYALLTSIRHRAGMYEGRYFVARPSRPMDGSSTSPSVPYGYLLNVSLRHLGAITSSSGLRDALEYLERLATDAVAALDLEQYYVWTTMFQTPETLPQFIQELVVSDHALTFRQIEPRVGLEVIRGVFTWVENDAMRSSQGWDLTDALRLFESVLGKTPLDGINLVFTRGLLQSSGISAATLAAMEKHFVFAPSEVNAGYLTPLDAPKSNYSQRPLVRLPDGSYMVATPSLSAMGFYEAIACGTREIWGSAADQKIGDAMETMLSNAFRSRGVIPTVTSRKYDGGDCDLLIETDEAVLLFELKKKSQRAESYGGNTLQVFKDLCLSAMKAQSQLGKQELLLLDQGHIEFLDGTIVSRRGRRIERIAVSLLDWGGTQDRLVLHRIAGNLLGAQLSVSSANPLLFDDLKLENATLKILGEQQQTLEALGMDPRNRMHNWWFMSIPQLLFVLNGMKEPSAFYKDLLLLRHTHTGTMDFYRDLHRWREMRNRTIQDGPDQSYSTPPTLAEPQS